MRNGWREATLGHLFEPSNERLGPHDSEPTVFSISKYDGVVPADDFFGKRVASAKLDDYKVLPGDAWVYSTIHIDEGSIARNTTGADGVVSPMYTVMRWISKLDEPSYAELLLRSHELLAVYSDSAQGSVNRRRSLPWRVFSELAIALPPLEEQRRIVDLIAAVDDAVDAAEAEVADAARAMWAVLESDLERAEGRQVRLGTISTIVRGGSPRPIREYETDDPAGLPWIKIGDIAADGMYITQTAVRIRPEGLKKTRMVKPGDFILSNSMSFGRPYISMIEGCIHDGWLALSDYQQSFETRFLYFLLRGAGVQAQFEALAAGSGVRNLKKESVAGVTVKVPSLAEQRNIVERAEALRDAADGARATADALRTLRSNLLTVLLSGVHEIPSSYDALLGEVA